MRNFLRSSLVVSLIGVFGAVSASDDPAVLVTTQAVGSDLEVTLEYLGDSSVVGLQVELSALGLAGRGSCERAGDSLGVCGIDGNSLKFASVNASLQALESGVLATFTIPNGAGLEISTEKVLFADAQAKEWQGELLIENADALRSAPARAIKEQSRHSRR